MSKNIIVGNIFSFIASCFLVYSCITSSRKKAYFFQMMESVMLCFSSVCFGMWAGLVTLIISIVRNLLVVFDKLDAHKIVICTISVFVFGVIINDKGLIGLMPVIGTIQLTLCSFYIKNLIGTKLSFLCNIIIWAVYSLLIYDFAAGLTQFVIAVITIFSIINTYKKES